MLHFLLLLRLSIICAVMMGVSSASNSNGEGPFGNTTSDIGVGFSDTALLLVSLCGFVFLAATVYSIILTKLDLSKNHGFADGGAGGRIADGDGDDYDTALDQADVTKLNRAQRRARAKNIMKRQRRVAPVNVVEGADDDGVAGGRHLVLAGANDPNHEGDDDDDASTIAGGSTVVALSRKERDRLAKQAEREERRVAEDIREAAQQKAMAEAQAFKQQRKLEQTKAAEVARQERLLRRQQQTQYDYQQWKQLLFVPNADDDGDDMHEFRNEELRYDGSMTVKEFAETAEKHKLVNLKDVVLDRPYYQSRRLADAVAEDEDETLHGEIQRVMLESRLERLVSEERRLTGVIVSRRKRNIDGEEMEQSEPQQESNHIQTAGDDPSGIIGSLKVEPHFMHLSDTDLRHLSQVLRERTELMNREELASLISGELSKVMQRWQNESK